MHTIYYLIWSTEHNAYWRPENTGYTRRQIEAGRYTKEEARKICESNSRRAGSTLPEDVPPEIMMVAPECVGAIHKTHEELTAIREDIAHQIKETGLPWLPINAYSHPPLFDTALAWNKTGNRLNKANSYRLVKYGMENTTDCTHYLPLHPPAGEPV